ncbi:50S ribosomal protein L4 [Rothia terrae]|jgi:large subunit ribosomal protein L4|uniref:50S ribosomal protein L4 n=1 Tax=Rothia terrae TaxID=396015 RepID=UPI001446CD33|nr:50S ribosomal protein L4 [Rothia terrae]NKZ34112.1 50S ribosomal protein L4 [Rothia terrae]
MAVKTLKVDLPADLFDAQASVPLLHQVVVAQLAAARQGTHKTKNRGEVSGAGRKPFKQKGTGRARQGSIRAPHMTGGGVVHGPTPRNYAQRTPKKMIAAALRGALSDRARNGRVHVVETLVEGTKPSTKAAKAALASISARKNALVVIDRKEDVVALSARNLENVHVLYADQLNTYDVLVSDDVVFTKDAFDVFVAVASKAKKEAAK